MIHRDDYRTRYYALIVRLLEIEMPLNRAEFHSVLQESLESEMVVDEVPAGDVLTITSPPPSSGVTVNRVRLDGKVIWERPEEEDDAGLTEGQKAEALAAIASAKPGTVIRVPEGVSLDAFQKFLARNAKDVGTPTEAPNEVP